MLCVIILFAFNYYLQPTNADTLTSEVGKVKTQYIFSIKEPTWIFNAGTCRGKHHDRQDLGFILRENTMLKIRQLKQSYEKELTIRLLGDDSEMEKTVTVDFVWTTISGNVPLVPFVDTPYSTNGAILEFLVESDKQKPLPKYKLNEDEKAFFKLWDTNNCDYALIQGKEFQMLLPKRNIAQAKNLEGFNSLKELIDHYDGLFRYYDQMAGFDDSLLTNQKGNNRYFLKIDTHGVGDAYYSNKWAACKCESVNMWLPKVSWGALHEIAHGYQAGFDGRGIFTKDVTNNLFGVQYEYDKYGDAADKIGWLFNYGNKTRVENDLYTKLINNNGTYESADIREKLILLTMLKQKAGNNAFTKMYQGYREKANQPGFQINEYELPDVINQYFSENSQLDFTPALEKWGFLLQNDQQEINRIKGYPAVASLADVVPKGKLNKVRAMIDPKLLITSNFEIVSNPEIAFLGLRGSVTIMLKTRNITELKGTKIQIKEGIKILQEQVIARKKVTFLKLSNGVYTVNFVGQAMAYYTIKQNYVFVKEIKNEAEIVLQKITISNLANQKMYFQGLGNNKVAEFSTNLNERVAIFSITSNTPHNYYGNQTYVSVNVSNSCGKIKYQNKVQGTNALVGSDRIPLTEGDKIEIYHYDAVDRLSSNEKIIDTLNQFNTWIVTKWGLENKKIGNNALLDFKTKIDSEAKRILQDESMGIIPTLVRKNLLVAIRSFEESNQSHLTESQLVKSRPSVFGTITIKLKENNIIELKETKIHLIEGSTVVKENNNNKENITFTKNSNGVYTVDFVDQAMTYYGVKDHHKNTIEARNNENITFEKNCEGNLANQRIALLGLGNERFGELLTDLNKKTATVSITSASPHYYYGNQTYASVKISDSQGNIKYQKIVTGTNALVGSDSVPLDEGDKIEIYHSETVKRLISNEKIINKSRKLNIWVVTKWGLENQHLKNSALSHMKTKISTETKRLLQEESKSFNPLVIRNLLLAINSVEKPYQTQLVVSKTSDSATIIIKLKTENISELKGSKIQIKKGTKVVQEKEIGEKTVVLNNLPNGFYTLCFNGDAMAYYIISNRYINVQGDHGEAEISLRKLQISNLANQKIIFLGLGNRLFAEFTTNLNEGVATFIITSNSPHFYYSNQTYVSVIVSDSQGNIKYDKVIRGKDAVIGSDIIPLAEGDEIEIYHFETGNRLKSKEEIIDASKNMNVWTVTKWGLENKYLKNSALFDFLAKIDKGVKRLLQDEIMNPTPVLVKKNLLAAFRSLQEPYPLQAVLRSAELARRYFLGPFVSIAVASIDFKFLEMFKDTPTAN